MVVAGFCLALALAFLSFAKVSFAGGRPHAAYRTNEQWASQSTIYITQAGFAAGRAVFDQVIPVPGPGGTQSYVPLVSDPSRFSSYAVVIAELANSDAVQKLMARRGPVRGVASASPVIPPDAPTASLPFVRIDGIATNPRDAVRTAGQATSALVAYMKAQQDNARIPAEKRVVLRVTETPKAAALLKGRSKTRPIFIFVASMCAVIGLVFILENLRPRLRLVSEQTTDDVGRASQSSRHSA